MVASSYFFNLSQFDKKTSNKNTNISFFTFCGQSSFFKIILLLKKPAETKRIKIKSWVNLSREGVLGIKNR